MTRIIDLTRMMTEDMPVFPGMEQPSFKDVGTLERDGFREKLLSLYSHTGTHLDAPAHILTDGSTLDRLPMETFFGPGLVIDLPQDGPGPVETAALEPFASLLPGKDFVLLRTGWSGRWGSHGYFLDYPFLSPEAALWLTGFGLKGVGVDTASVDPVDSRELPIHHIFFEHGLVIAENLCGLEELPVTGFDFLCLPLKIAGSDGAPVRAAALLP